MCALYHMYSASEEESESDEENTGFLSFEDVENITRKQQIILNNISQVFPKFDYQPPHWKMLDTWTRPNFVWSYRRIMYLFNQVLDQCSLDKMQEYLKVNGHYRSTVSHEYLNNLGSNKAYAQLDLSDFDCLFHYAKVWNLVMNNYHKNDSKWDKKFIDAWIVLKFIEYLQRDKSVKSIFKYKE